MVDDVGGGFGMKTGLYPEDIAVAYATRLLQRPVKWTAERIEEFLAATHGRDVTSHAELALDADGKVLGYRLRSLCNMGAYAGTSGILIQLMIGPWVSTSIYDIRTIDFDLRAVLTNTAPTGAYRGAGRPEAIYLIERLFDVAAQKLGLDPAEIRRRNLIAPEQMPYRNAMGQTYDSGKFETILDQGLALARWSDFPARAAESKARGKLRGRGLASFLEWTGGNVFEERVTRLGLGRRRDRDLCRDHADGPGHRHVLRSARGRRVRRADRPDPHRHGRHRSRPGFRQRRLALALHRRLSHPPRLGRGRIERPDTRRRGARSGRGGYRLSGRRVPHRRHGSPDRVVRVGRPAARAAHLYRRDQQGERAELAQWLPSLRSRSGSRNRRRRQSCPMSRPMMSAGSSTR
ncbi:MAG: molybdopterin cofactor-binding domain-containing protein [Aliidongia sp.]